MDAFVKEPVNRTSKIGVICKEQETAIVEEFFEFFKTPWEFHVPGRSYDVVMCTRPEITNVAARLLVVYSSQNTVNEKEAGAGLDSQPHGRLLEQNGVRVPIYGNILAFDEIAAPLLCLEESNRAVAFQTAAHDLSIVRVGYDLFHEVEFLLCTGQPPVNAGIPTLEIHISMLRDWILAAGIPVVEVPAVPQGHEFIVCLTHDVDFMRIRDHKFDHTMWGFLRRASVGSLLDLVKRKRSWIDCLKNLKAIFLLPAVYLRICKDFWFEDFERFLRLERDLKATFFFIPFKNRPGDKVQRRHPERRAAAYDVDEERALLQNLMHMGHEVAVHGIDAWHSVEKGRQEHRRLAEATQRANLGVRIHWLCFDDSSPQILDEAGFQYDSTVGYNETVGYKAGTMQVFRPKGTKSLLELPLHIQDGALFYPRNLSLTESQAWRLCEGLVRNASTYGGVLTVLWHTRSLAPERLWGHFYVRLLEALKVRRPWFGTAGQVVEWFRKRRALSFRDADVSERHVRVVVEYDGSGDGNPDLMLRVHEPKLHAASGSARTFVDIPWTGQSVIDIPLGAREGERALESCHAGN